MIQAAYFGIFSDAPGAEINVCAFCQQPGIRSTNLQLPAEALCFVQMHTDTFLLLALLGMLLLARGGEGTGRIVSSPTTELARWSLPADTLHTHLPLQCRISSESKNSLIKGSTLTLLNRFKKLHISFDLKAD